MSAGGFKAYRDKMKGVEDGRSIPAPPFAPGGNVSVESAMGTVDLIDAHPACATCLAFHPDPVEAGKPIAGECRRYAPKPGVVEDLKWPVVDGDDWCLQHRQNRVPYNLTFVPSDASVDVAGADD